MTSERNPTRRRGRALESAIFEATFAELATVGVEALTLERVSARAGAGKASVYRRWRTPVELIRDALAHLDAEVLPPMGPSSGDLRADLLVVLNELADQLKHVHGQAFRALITHRERYPHLHRQAVDIVIAPRQALLTAIFDAAAERGEISPTAVTRTLVGSGPQVVLARYLVFGDVSEDDCAAIVDELIMPAATRVTRP